MTRLVPLIVAIVLVVSTGVVSGIWKGRWSTSQAAQEAATRIQNVPMKVGDWEGETSPFDAEDYAAAGIQGGFVRVYTHTQTGDRVSIMLVCGRPGPISVHTPEVCYPGVGFKVLSERIPTKVELDGGDPAASFWTWRMGKLDGPIPQLLNVTYAWSDDGQWKAPGYDARIAFASSPALFKLYAIREVPASVEAKDPNAPVTQDDPTVQFLRVMIPELKRSLFPVTPPAS
jgi:hypothetical protein